MPMELIRFIEILVIASWQMMSMKDFSMRQEQMTARCAWTIFKCFVYLSNQVYYSSSASSQMKKKNKKLNLMIIKIKSAKASSKAYNLISQINSILKTASNNIIGGSFLNLTIHLNLNSHL